MEFFSKYMKLSLSAQITEDVIARLKASSRHQYQSSWKVFNKYLLSKSSSSVTWCWIFSTICSMFDTVKFPPLVTKWQCWWTFYGMIALEEDNATAVGA